MSLEKQRKYAPVIQAVAHEIAAERMPVKTPGQGTCLYHAAAALRILNPAPDVPRHFELYAGEVGRGDDQKLITFRRGVPGLYHAWVGTPDGEVIADFSTHEIPGVATSLGVPLNADVPQWNWAKTEDSPFWYRADRWTTNLLRGVLNGFADTTEEAIRKVLGLITRTWWNGIHATLRT